MDENAKEWRPELGEVVIYKPLRKRKGLEVPEQRVTVFSLHPSGTIGVRLRDGAVRPVNLESLHPIKT